ncbi:MAG: M28 family metallopeptidase, partial [Halanaerobiales bacterium]
DKNIIFIGFGGEEINLKGSFYYAHHPLFDLDKTSVINMDMIGEPFEIYNAESADVPMIEKLNRVLSIGYGIETNQSGKSYPSDNKAFEYISDEKGEINKKNIIATGTPDTQGIIHTRQDTPDKLNYEEIKKITKALLTYIYNEAY